MSRGGREQNFEVFERVKFGVRTAKSVKCTFPDGGSRFVPFSQMPEGFEPLAEGEEGDLEVSEWLAGKWSEEEPEREDEGDVEIEGCTVMRETDKAIAVRVSGVPQPIWIPRTQVLERSACKYDGDSGTLVITSWIAKQKGLGGNSSAAPRPATNVGQDSRRRAPAADRQTSWGNAPGGPTYSGTGHHAPGPRQSVGPDPDDDIPF